MNVFNHSNHLSGEKSPYLLQHADNPVKWYPWGNKAFDLARKEDKPIFLSIGYSTCHWCHVMEHESFEDEDVAKLLNENFISVKVDREERPDIDNVYMSVCQMMTGSGGWPLTIIMTPDKKPFFAATYIPKESKWGRTGLIDLVPKITNVWQNKRDEVLASAEQITSVLNNFNSRTESGEIKRSLATEAYNSLENNYDKKNGGFGTAPKFPTPTTLLLLLRYWKNHDKNYALEMVKTTLKNMRNGGIFDQVGYGFHRYSTDSHWLVPHFEKMLYDQALLAIVYLEAYQASEDKFFADSANEIFSYILWDMTSEEGGFYSAEDADSEGKEGKFYLWALNEIKNSLNKDDAKLALKAFNIKEPGNFKEESTGRFTGENILHLNDNLNDLAKDFGISEDEFKIRLNEIRHKLFTERVKRIHPYKDDKILSDWNGLMIAALALGGRILNRPEYSIAAEKSITFIRDKMLTDDYRLLHRYRDGDAAIPGNIDDYTFIVWGLIELYETTFNAEYLKLAILLTNTSIEHFWDKQNSGFYFSPDDGEKLLSRTIDFYDGAVPSGNSIALYNLSRLKKITGDKKWEKFITPLINRAAGHIDKNPAGYSMFISALEIEMGKSVEIVITGNVKNNLTQEMIREINKHYIPNKSVIFNPTNHKSPLIHELAPFIKNYISIDNTATAYVCKNQVCSRPTNDIKILKNLLKNEASINHK